MQLLTELKRRNVFRMAGLYLVAAWLVAQVGNVVLTAFEAPGWVLRTILIVLALGFIPALVFAWVFELTPDGFKRDSEVPAEESIAPQTARRMNRVTFVLLAIAVIYFAVDKLVLMPQRDAELVTQTTARISADAESARAKANSIAVLPFVNMSDDAGNEYFSDGISEEILNVLASTPELQVAARTSSFSYKGRNIEVPQIARDLGVRLVLEGSVRKQDDRVRVTAQLIQAEDGFHLWSQTFDRQLDDIFAIQDEIAKAIGDALKVTVGGAQGAGHAVSGTTDLEAYDLYLRGIALWHARQGDGLWQAIELFEQAAQRDPTFAQAWAGQALAYGVMPWYSNRMSWRDALPRASDAALRALALDPVLPEAYAALGEVAMIERRLDTADTLLQRAIALRPSFATASHWRAMTLLASGRPEEALAEIERASELDARSPIIGDNHAFILMALGRLDEARMRCRQVLALESRFQGCLQYAGIAALLQGDHDEARVKLRTLWQAERPGLGARATDRADALVDAMAGHGDREAVARWLASLPFNSGVDPASDNVLEDQMVALLLVELGEPALALDFFERTGRELGTIMDWAIVLPQLDPIRCEPRFRAIVERLRTHDPRAARVCGATPAIAGT